MTTVTQVAPPELPRRARYGSIGAPSPLTDAGPDPLAGDAPDDLTVVTTRRRMVRLALAAADAGARFARQDLGLDAAEWLLSPSPLFHGRAPVDACQERSVFCRMTIEQRFH